MAITKEKGLKLLCELEGYHQALKMVHWSTDNHSRHILTDEIDKAVLEYEDRIAENLMGYLGTKYGRGDLKALLPSSSELEGILTELSDDIATFRLETGEVKDDAGVANIIDDFAESLNRWKYLATLK